MPKRGLIVLAIAAALSATALTAGARTADAPRIVTGFVANTLCTGTFVTGADPDRLFAETTAALPGVNLISWAIGYRVDRERKQVTSTVFGGIESRAIHREGLGCYLAHSEPPAESSLSKAAQAPALLPEIAGSAVVEPMDPALKRALDNAFAEPAQPFRNTKAVVIVKDGKVIAERYADGYSKDAPILGFSMTKSVINALIGILVRQGKLSVLDPAPIAAWRNPDDPRRTITIDHLLKHTSGLAMGSSLASSVMSAFAPVNRMKFSERDMAAYAATASLEAAPGTYWNYHDGNTVLLSRIIRDAVGTRATDVMQFVRRELFDPLGIRSAVIEFDATGTPEGSSQMLATARDWARFGLLYLNDGVVGGRRILPEGWVDYSANPVPEAWVGMGAGFWTNRGDSKGARYRGSLGMPKDAFYASGTFGQYVVVVPSQRLVVVRLGITAPMYDIEGVSRLAADVIAITGERASAQR
ncbi:MAG: serine hydrolase domain-containing protein [Pseudomonadota bacterium]